ncbi:MAG: TIGR03960 family B12-binding radical SAM protein [Deltaproteobacteria bacterium]|nr:MAG: TIGR03960 family B12-binding radical SAM protein [Deltaproteobacteria bacterium]
MWEGLLPFVRKPSSYIDGELNTHRKDPTRAEVLFGFCFPEVYEIGMSYVGLQILYHLLNSLEGVVCERVFAPFPDMEALMRKEGLPLVSLESRIPLKEFDILGFSLQYELTYTNLLNILDLGGIPLLSSQRDRDMPLVIAGGPGAMQPEPLADFVDAFVLGEGEEVLPRLVEVYRSWKRDHGTKDELLMALSRIPGVYVPSFFRFRWDRQGLIEEIQPLHEGYGEVRRQVVGDLDRYPFPSSPIVPLCRVVHDRLSIEVVRGCLRGCRFCQAGFIYRPLRERRPEELLEVIEEALHRTGYDELSLLALSIGDCSFLEPFVSQLISRIDQRRIALSLPSLRIGTVGEGILRDIKRIRKTGITVAPEAATERLQRVINKVIPEEEIMRTARMAFREGWRHIKLYFMIGLPTERLEDVREIASLAKRISEIGGQVNVSVSTFVPKAHTPFQWEGMLSMEEIEERHRILKAELKGKGLRFKWHNPKMSVLEGIFSRGDRRLGRVLMEAFKGGCRLDGWSEYLDWQKWQEAFWRAGIDPSFYLRERDSGEILPWGHLKSGVEERYLLEERQRARAGQVTSPCKPGCRRCGCCSEQLEIRLSAPFVPEASPSKGGRTLERRPWVKKIRAKFYKIGPVRFLSHLETVDVFIRAMRRAQIPMKFSEGFHHLPRATFTQALPVGIESLCEYLDVEISSYFPPEEFVRRMNRELPRGLGVIDAKEMAYRGTALPELLQEDLYLVSLGVTPPPFQRERPLYLEVRKGGKVKRVNLWDFVREVRVIRVDQYHPAGGFPPEGPKLEEIVGERVLLVRMKKGLRPYHALQGLLGLSEREVLTLRILKVESFPPLF